MSRIPKICALRFCSSIPKIVRPTTCSIVIRSKIMKYGGTYFLPQCHARGPFFCTCPSSTSEPCIFICWFKDVVHTRDCIHTKALVFMFNGGSSYGFTISNEKYMHHGFLAPQAYLFSTSLLTFHVRGCPEIVNENTGMPHFLQVGTGKVVILTPPGPIGRAYL